MQIFLSDLLLVVPLILQLAGFAIVVFVDSYISRDNKEYMKATVVLVLSLILQNVMEYYLIAVMPAPYLRTCVSIFGYCIRPFILINFIYFVSPDSIHKREWAAAWINTAIYLTALFSNICFEIKPDNVFSRGPLGYTCHVVSGLLMFQLLYYSFKEYYRIEKADEWIPIINIVVIVGSVVMDTFFSPGDSAVSFLTIAIVNSAMFYYIWLHMRLVRQHEKALRAEQRIQIMMSQIQPHFLFNTLSTIQALIRIDPEMAFETTEKFGSYLRQNIDSLRQPELIPVSKELEHTRVYADIEIIRFPSISVEYDIQDDSFSVPALTIQPLVENAIRHGVRIRDNGIVKVSTHKLPAGHGIVIEDNGKGFDVETAVQSDESHIGLRNVRERIEEMCGGTLSIESSPGEGTTIRIFIPDKKDI